MWPSLLLYLNMWRTFWDWLKGRGQESLEQQATVNSSLCTADSLGEGSENQNVAGNQDCEGQANADSDGSENSLGYWHKGHPCYIVAKSLASLCPCPEAPWKAELQSDQLVCLAGEVSKQRSIQAAAWLLLTAYSLMREERDDLKTELLKWETEQLSQRRNRQGMKRKGWPEQDLAKRIKADKQRLMVLNPGNNNKKAFRGSKKRFPKLTGDSGLLAKRSLTSVMIPMGLHVAPVSHRPWQCSFSTGDFESRKNFVTKRKPWEARKKEAFRLESLWRTSDTVMPPIGVQVKPHQRPQKKSSDASVLRQPQKAASSVKHTPLKAANIGLQPSIAATRVGTDRARRLLPPGLQITSGSIPEVETPRRAHTAASLSKNVQTELRHRAPSAAVPTAVIGVGLQTYQHGRPGWKRCGKRLQLAKTGAATQASKAPQDRRPVRRTQVSGASESPVSMLRFVLSSQGLSSSKSCINSSKRVELRLWCLEMELLGSN